VNYKAYIKLGLNHHLLYRDACREPGGHERTLMQVLQDDRWEVLDIWIPKSSGVQRREIEALRQSGKEIYYNIGTRQGLAPAHPASLDPAKRRYSLDFYKDELDRALAVGAKKVITNSGPDFPETRQACIEALVEFYCEICAYVPADLLIMIEPTDREIDKKKLMGPSRECVELCRRVHQAGHKNFASMVDMGHLPLMGETIRQAMYESRGFIGHIHLGNCILKNRRHPLFGDKHVPWGLPESEYDVDELAELLRVGLEIGYFRQEGRGSASFEMRPYPDKSPEETLEIAFDKFEQAWGKATAGSGHPEG